MKKQKNIFLLNNSLEKSVSENNFEELIPSDKNKIKKSDYDRISDLYSKWWKCLINMTLCYFYTYFVTIIFEKMLVRMIRRMAPDQGIRFFNFWRIMLFFFLMIFKGLSFCADGIVGSWLKTPFGQICYSINKSGIDYELADEIVTKVTEVNEHFKETFKKFGILTIAQTIGNFWRILERRVSEDNFKEKKEYNYPPKGLWNLSFIVPLALAYYRSADVIKTIKKLAADEKNTKEHGKEISFDSN